jgi:PadR family transcriptional regulator, regulatory protein PadR
VAVPERITAPTLDVLEILLQAQVEGGEPHGWAIMKAVGRSGPTVYGVLDRLEDAGWISGRWQDNPADPNRPRRRCYTLTATGSTAARDLLAARRPEAVTRPARRRGPVPGPGRPRPAPSEA